MGRSLNFKTCLALLLFLTAPALVWAVQPISLQNAHDQQEQKKQDDKKQDSKKPDKKETSDQTPNPVNADIKEVPKARKQFRPTVVVKPKVKPIKIIRPKIKRP